jgi:hypothetical protein
MQVGFARVIWAEYIIAYSIPEKISPAKAPSAAAFPDGFLCAFAPLRGRSSFQEETIPEFMTLYLVHNSQYFKEKV